MKSTFKTFAAILAIAALGMASSASAQLLNPGFELDDASGGDVAGATNWGTFNGVFTTAAVFHNGLQSVKTFGPFVVGGGAGGTQMLPAVEGETWVGEIYALNSTLDPIDAVDFGVYKIEFLDAALNLVAGGLLGVDVFESNPVSAASPLDQWTLLGVGTAPAPAGTAWAQAVFVKVDIDGAGGGSIFWDDASLGIESVATESTSLGQVKSLY